MSVRDILVPRRSFLVSLGLATGALALGVAPAAAKPPPAPEASSWRRPTFEQMPVDGGLTPNAFVHIAADGLVTIACARSEMGQGVRSSLPALVADELGADPARVAILQADGDEAYGNQDTDGSSSVRGDAFGELRRLGATARLLLVTAASKRWKVPAAQCEARDHEVVHAATKRKLGFGDLAVEAAKLPLPKSADVALRPLGELRRVGKLLPHIDAPAIVTGKAIFGADVRLSEMLTAVIARPPVVGGKVATRDATRALRIPGVKRVIDLPMPAPPFAFQPLGGVAVLADTTWAAMRGRAALDVTWDAGSNVTYDSTAYREALLAAVRAPGKQARDVGNVDTALTASAKRIVAEYCVPHLAHTPMEPPVSVARVDANGCEVWTPTQAPQDVREQVSKALGIEPSKVRVHVTLLGGAFGRKAKPDYDVEAALLSKAAGVPVRVQWTRTDDIQHGYYHTTSAQRLEAGLDASGKVVAWLHRTAFPSISSTFAKGVTHASNGELGQGVLDIPLAIPNVRAENGEAVAHVRIGWLRSVCNIHHAFAMSSFLDEIAHARGLDPRANLLELLGPDRHVTAEELGVKTVPNYGEKLDRYPIDVARFRGCVERVTELSRWADRAKDGRSLGLAVHHSFVTYVAVVASVVKDERGKVRVDEAWVVADAGTVVNPDRVKAMMEGAVIFGMSLALHGAITMKNGAVEQTNFRDYRLARMPEAPRAIHVDLIESSAPPGGAGEPGLPPVAPAIANAVFALTGTRVRDLPMARLGLV
ncbi:MAG: molybdopterin cofactor-binding domain-containing protein [Polyangiaceae bacterium]